MNTVTTVIGSIVLLLVIFFGVLFLYNKDSALSITATSTPTGVTGDTNMPAGANGQAAGKPVATTASTVTPNNVSAAVFGSVVPNGAYTTYWYEYGTSANLGSKTAVQSIGSGFDTLAAPYYITGLTKDTTYYYRVVAENQFGKTEGTTLTLRTTVGPVAIVGSIPTVKSEAANAVSASAATVNGHLTPNKAATTYWFEYGKTKDLGFTTTLQSAGDGSVSMPAAASLQSLEPGTTYYFRINAQNMFGTVNGTTLTFKTAGQAVVAVPVVTTQLPSPVATTTVTLRGTVNAYGAQTTYWFEYSTDASFNSALKTTAHKSVGAGVTTSSIEQTVTGLNSNTTYYFRTVAENNGGTVKGDVKSFKTK
jgi:phosphodiesterase/alkaline phosphatase D-like protein